MARTVLYPDFQAFIDEKGLEKPCVECAANDWQMLGSDDGPPDPREGAMFLAALPELTDVPWRTERSFANYVMYCGSCGTIKLIAAPVVWEWLEKRNG